MTDQLSDQRWWVCHECGIHRRVPDGESTICEINGAGSPMEEISEAVADLLTQADGVIVKAWAERDQALDALREAHRRLSAGLEADEKGLHDERHLHLLAAHHTLHSALEQTQSDPKGATDA